MSTTDAPVDEPPPKEPTPTAPGDAVQRGVLARRDRAEAALSALEGRWRVPPAWEEQGGAGEMGAELAVMGWDLEWFESSLKRRAVRLLWQEHRLVCSRQYRDWFKLLAQMRRLERGGGRWAMADFPAYRETEPERVYPMELLPALAAEVAAGAARWRAKGSDVWIAYAGMFETWSRDLVERHGSQWDRLQARIDLEAG